MPRNGGIRGKDNLASSSSVSGIWTLPEHFDAMAGGRWFYPQIVATGGSITEADGYRIHTFTSSGTFTVSSVPEINAQIQYLVVAGGGGAGGRHSGGGGGGQVTYNSSYTVSAQSYTVTVGAGGAGVYGSLVGVSGSDSYFIETAKGGGASGSYNGIAGLSGGSGGGNGHPGTQAAGSSVKTSSTVGALTYGTAGAVTTWGGGGGGAGSAPNGYNGGNGFFSSINGSPLYWGAGGGGSVWDSGTAGNGGLGGAGGGGSAGTSQSPGIAGTGGINPGEDGQNTNSYNGPGPSKGGNAGANTGSGGGGCGQSEHASYTNTSINRGGNGGSGIVIIRYPIQDIPVPSMTTSGLMLSLDASDTSSYPGTGTTWYDISGNSRHCSGSATFSSVAGGSFVFNNNEFIGSSSGITGNTARTIGGWHKLNTSDDIPFSLGNVASTGNSAFAYSPTGATSASIYGLVGTYDEGVTTSINVLDNQWHYSAITWDAANPGTIKIYVDGQLSGTLTRSSGEAYSTDDGYVIGDWGNNDRPLVSNASVASFHVYNRELSQEEINNNYLATKSRFL